MNEMIERVARAICESERMNPDDALGGWIHWKDAAKSAIEAMLEPTEAMIKAGTTGWDAMDGSPIKPMFDPTNPYKAMIKAALK